MPVSVSAAAAAAAVGETSFESEVAAAVSWAITGAGSSAGAATAALDQQLDQLCLRVLRVVRCIHRGPINTGRNGPPPDLRHTERLEVTLEDLEQQHSTRLAQVR